MDDKYKEYDALPLDEARALVKSYAQQLDDIQEILTKTGPLVKSYAQQLDDIQEILTKTGHLTSEEVGRDGLRFAIRKKFGGVESTEERA